MVTSGLYDYVNVLDKAADASWLRNDAIANNIANADTPGYKREDVDFQSVLESELGKSRYESLDSKVKDVSLSDLSVTTKTDSSGYSYRLDENNVDPEQENVELASNQIYYQGVTDSITNEFSRMKMVLN